MNRPKKRKAPGDAREPPIKDPLSHDQSLDAVVRLFQRANHIVVVSGAGISTNAGIPDFRSEGGIYSQLGHLKVDTPEDIFHIDFFNCDPQPFYTFSKNLLSKTDWKPTLSHRFVKLLETRKKLLRMYTQNIDGLETAAGISSSKLLQVHGSFASASCTACRFKTSLESIKPYLERGQVFQCPKCFQKKDGIVKPDIIFFGENYSNKFQQCVNKDKPKVDLLVVMGSSLKISPIAGIKNQFPAVPSILINKQELESKHAFDYILRGDSDVIVCYLCRQLGWDELAEGPREKEEDGVAEESERPVLTSESESGQGRLIDFSFV
ncbi:DHS-like NAD/FAD-binding domain-containing protein [Chytriomyces sp. MP71]|nr:DHS-like NAD/FAD-binding domain-containing protein [Chytriomyces sp. MP71]